MFIRFLLLQFLSLSLLSAEIHPQLMEWAEQVHLGESAQAPLTEFPGYYDKLIKKTLGQKLFNGRVAKVELEGRRFVFIADNHTRPEFINLKEKLIKKVNGSEKAILFVEGFLRDPEDEKQSFAAYLPSREFKGSLYGLDNYGPLSIQTLFQNLIATKPQDQQLQRYMLLSSIASSPTDAAMWDAFQKQLGDPSLTEMIAALNKAIGTMRTVEGERGHILALAELAESAYWRDNDAWDRLITALILDCLNTHDFAPDIRNMAKQMLESPSRLHQQAPAFFQRLIRFRDQLMADHIKELLPAIPEDREILVITGFLHLPGIVEELQGGTCTSGECSL